MLPCDLIMRSCLKTLQICAGLKEMHMSDPPYAHHDMKPGNVLLSHHPSQPPLAVIMDFGSSTPARKQIRSRSQALTLQVTSEYDLSSVIPFDLPL